MRKYIIALAAAGTTLAIATPAAAQYYPQPQPYGYNNGYNGNGYGYGRDNWGQVRVLQMRLNNVERQINRLDRRDRIRNNAADRLRFEANQLEQRLRYAGRGGLNPYEANDINVRIARLEQRVQFAMNNRYGGYGAYGWNGNNGYNNGQFVDRDRDRDRDGRDDRYEDDRGNRHDD